MSIVDLSIKRPIMIGMGLIACVIFGALAYFGMPQGLFPDLAIPYVTVQTVYAGASPSVIETQITKKVEDQISSISGLDSIISYSIDNASIVMAEFKYGTDENVALLDVKDKVEAISGEMPIDADKPIISKVNMSSTSPVMSIVLEGDLSPTALHTFATTTVSDGIAQIAGVGSVEVSGGVEREIHVDIDRSTVYERSIPVTQVAGILAAANVALPGGNLNFENRDIPIQLKGEYESLDDIKNLDIPTSTGIFKLRQLASIEDSTTTARERTILLDRAKGTRNENAVLIKVIKNPTANTVQLVDDVMKKIPRIEAMSGGHVRMKVVKEDATYVRDSVRDTLSTVYLGVIFTGLVLLLFLHDLRSTIIIALSMPFSIISTFLVMKAFGLSLNMISLLGLSSSTGTLVANSVVVLENIFRHKQMGKPRIEAASSGTTEVLVAVFASTLTNIVVFVPLASINSLMGSVLREFSLTIVIATVFSIIVSFTLTPMLASRLLPEGESRQGKIGNFIEGVFARWSRAYSIALAWMLKTRRRSVLVVAGTVVAFALSIGLARLAKFELMPITDGGKVQIAVELQQGNDLERTAALVKAAEEKVLAFEEVEIIQTDLGSLGSLDSDVSVAQMNVFLKPKAKRSRSNKTIANEMTKELSRVPGATFRVTPLSEISMGSTGSAIDLYLKGIDTDTLQGIADRVKAIMERTPGVTNVALSSKPGKVELVFRPDRKQISEDGITVQTVAFTLRTSVDGYVSTAYKESGNEYDVRVKLTGTDLSSIEDVRNIPIATPAGTYPLSRYADVSFENGTNKILRTDKNRAIEITCDLLPGYSAGNMQNVILSSVKKEIEMPNGYSFGLAGTSEMMNDTMKDLAFAFLVAIILTFMVLAATLESMTQPLFILATIPLSLIGVIASALLTGATMNFISIVGIIMLVGIVVNNAILMLDYYNQLHRGGMGMTEALVKACPEKLKAILMSNIAIIMGQLSMALGIGASGAEMRQPLGIITIGGIVSSTIMTLFLIPALEYTVSKTKHKRAAKKNRANAIAAEPPKEIF